MGKNKPITLKEVREVERLSKKTYNEIAAELGISFDRARYIYRKLKKDKGLKLRKNYTGKTPSSRLGYIPKTDGRSKFSDYERKYIYEHAKEKTAREIANKLGVNIRRVDYFITSRKLKQ